LCHVLKAVHAAQRFVSITYDADGERLRVVAGSGLLRLNFCGWAFDCGDEFLEMWVTAEALQILVGQEAIGIFIPSIEGFL